MTPPLRHVLLDADGVLQSVRRGWWTVVEEHLGSRATAFAEALAAAEEAALRGEDDFPEPGLGRLLAAVGSSADPGALYPALWLDLELCEEALDVAADLRAAGHGVHLATNQHARRARYMREDLRLPDHLDGAYWSCDLGVAKPDPAYFRAVLADLGAAAEEVAFVDDTAANVAVAGELGLRAVQWRIEEGTAPLRSRLAAVGATLLP